MSMRLSDCRELILATTNPHKVRELTDLLIPLRIPIRSLADESDIRPVDEDGKTIAENARKKGIGYATQLGKWVLADDTGLEVDALDGAPGVRSARYAGDDATQAMNLALLIEHMKQVADEERGARFVCYLCLADPEGSIVLESNGESRGRIGRQPIGEYGFGYDSVFEVAGLERTLAELDEETTAQVGHRGKAARALIEKWQRQASST